MNHIAELRSVIHKLRGAKAKHVHSVPVREEFQGQVVWDGIVEVFDLSGHPQTTRIYAWTHLTEDPKHPKRYVTVLHIPPVVSPETAVRAAIIQESKECVTEAKKTRKPGRPKLPKGNAKGRFLRVRVTPIELRTIEAAAHDSGKKVSEWIRGVVYAALTGNQV